MTERGHSLDVAPACPFVAFDDERDERSDRPSPRHRCYAETPPSPLAREHQEQYCLSPGFAVCPIFQTWARREAARVQHPSLREDADVRLREPAAPAFPPATALPVPELPPRQVQQGPWSQPPPWLHSSGGPESAESADDDRLDRLVARRGTLPGAPGGPGEPVPPAADAGIARPVEPPGFLTRPVERPAGAGLAGSIADESAAAALASRLAAIGMGDAGQAVQAPAAASPAVPVPPVLPAGPAMSGPSMSGQAYGAQAVAPIPAPAPVRRVATPEDDIIGARVVREPGASSGLSRILRLGRAQEPLDARGAAGGGTGRGRDRGRVPEPSWERPRRNEAYPTIRRRVGMPTIPRVALGAIALALAAGFLFFVVPPLFLGDDSGGPGATGAPSGAAASGSPAPSRTPVRSAAPTPRVYVVRSGDTLSTIADRFGLTVDEILEANPDIKNPNQIAVGDRIVIPTKAAEERAPAEEESAEPSASE